jgi:spore coat protein U-like protein
MRASIIKVSLLGALLCTSSAVFAQATGNLPVRANVPHNCKVQNVVQLNFGAYDPVDLNAATPLDANGSFDVKCTKNASYTITLSQGSTPAGGSSCSSPLRQMANGAERLRYDLFSDSPGGTAWGCDAGTDVAGSETVGPSSPDTFTVYGRVPAGQDVAGSTTDYTDTVVVTVTF